VLSIFYKPINKLNLNWKKIIPFQHIKHYLSPNKFYVLKYIFYFIRSFLSEFSELESMMTKLILKLLKSIELKTSYNVKILFFYDNYNWKPFTGKNSFPFYFSNKFLMYFLKVFWTLIEILAIAWN